MIKTIVRQFNYKRKQLRTINISGNVWFYGKDVLDLLGYKPHSKAIQRLIPKNHQYIISRKRFASMTNRSNILWHGNDYQSKRFIDQGSVLKLIGHSQLSNTQPIQDWIFYRVMPNVINKGGYVSNPMKYLGQMNNRQINVVEHTLNVIKKRNNQLVKSKEQSQTLAKKKKQMTPTYDYGRGMSANLNHTFTTKEAAHIFSQRFNIVNCGTVNFNRLLRSKPMSILSNQRGKNHNLPRKHYLDHKWCKVHYTHIISPYRHKKIACRTIYFTAKGIKGILDKFKRNRIFIPYQDWNPAVLDTKWLDKNYIYKNKKYLEHCGGKSNIHKIHYVQDIL